MSAAAQSITFDGISYTNLVGGKLDYQVALQSVNSNPFVTTGNFGLIEN